MEIPHEVMHALGLEHTFEEKEHPNKEHIFYAIDVFVGQKHTLLSF